MTVYGRILLAGAGSLALLLGAFGFQYLGGLAPCPLCVWQRWPHAAAVVVAVLAVTVLWKVSRAMAGLGAAAMVASLGLAAFHVGVEQGWWSGFEGCSAPDPTGMSAADLLDRLETTEIVRCDDVAWSFGGISMAGWNGIVSLALLLVWVWSARPQPPIPARGS